ncbi:MAG: EthD domain-containing protein [Chloroflexi bacterium]|nr:EthD domain-containing protein [Chloroflexota bacterium]
MTEKLVFLTRRASQLSREEFLRRYLHEHAPLVLQHCPNLRKYVVNLVDVSREKRDPPPLEEHATVFDAVAEQWFDSLDDYTDQARRFGSPEGAAAVEASEAANIGAMVGYQVIERVHQDYERSWSDGERSPGVKLLATVRRAEGITHEQFVDHWLHKHVPLVFKVLLGTWRYVTNEVVAPLTPGAPEIDGIVEVHFRDIRDRRFDSPEGEKLMMEDVQQFLLQPTRNQASEYVLRS